MSGRGICSVGRGREFSIMKRPSQVLNSLLWFVMASQRGIAASMCVWVCLHACNLFGAALRCFALGYLDFFLRTIN